MALLEIASLQMSLLKVRSCWSTTRAGPGPEPNSERPGEMRTDTGGHIGTEAETGERVHRQGLPATRRSQDGGLGRAPPSPQKKPILLTPDFVVWAPER